MRINQYTKISELIKANELCIDAIASIAKPLRKIKIPLLRKVLTPRVNIWEASRIANCSVEDFRLVLEPLGFIWEGQDDNNNLENSSTKRPNWLDQGEQIVTLDVRPILETGKDPLKEIMAVYKPLAENDVLEIVNTFLPFPLINLLEKKGAVTHSEKVSDNEYHVFFHKAISKEANKSNETKISFVPFEVVESIISSKDSNIKKLDVRGLPMPQPMETILKELSVLKDNESIYVLHHKVPLYLLEELENMPYQVFVSEVDGGDVRMLIYQ